MPKKDTSVNQITEGVIWKQLLIFFFPIMLGTLFQQLYNTADAVVVGRFVGTKALAAVGRFYRPDHQPYRKPFLLLWPPALPLSSPDITEQKTRRI